MGIFMKNNLGSRIKFMSENGIARSTDNLATIYAQGDSMSPTINDGQVLPVNTTDVTPKSSKIYLIGIDDQLYINASLICSTSG